jgi:hypothetical protein
MNSLLAVSYLVAGELGFKITAFWRMSPWNGGEFDGLGNGIIRRGLESAATGQEMPL